MAVYREAPKCPKCGGNIKGKYWQPKVVFAGDTFRGWDFEGHVCRVGTKYFIERTDTHQWWSDQSWTTDPMSAMIFSTKDKAENYLKDSLDIPPRIPCEVTEHEFVNEK